MVYRSQSTQEQQTCHADLINFKKELAPFPLLNVKVVQMQSMNLQLN